MIFCLFVIATYRYIEALKSEREVHHVVTNAGDQPQSSNKKLQELEKTILSLKRLVEKLQVENKRLQSRPCSSTSTSTDRKVYLFSILAIPRFVNEP